MKAKSLSQHACGTEKVRHERKDCLSRRLIGIVKFVPWRKEALIKKKLAIVNVYQGSC